MTKVKGNMAINILLVICGIIAGLAIAEGVLRLGDPYRTFGAGREWDTIRKSHHDLSKIYTIDPEMGFMPILGNGYSGYTKYGTIQNGYSIEKRPGVTRLLFMGDSVTGRAKIVNALRHVYGEKNFEYWNAGVEAWATTQEVNFYKKYNWLIKPDHVILTFHNNDFETTPVAFFNSKKQLVVYAPNEPVRDLNPWLFKNSYLYRMIIGLTLSEKNKNEAMADEIRNSLRELRDILNRDHIALTVLIHPVLKPYREWSSEEIYSRKKSIQILKELGIRYFDLSEISEKAIKDNVHVQETDGDILHPGDELSMLFAKYLFEKRLLKAR
jgi:hypothetical protein